MSDNLSSIPERTGQKERNNSYKLSSDPCLVHLQTQLGTLKKSQLETLSYLPAPATSPFPATFLCCDKILRKRPVCSVSQFKGSSVYHGEKQPVTSQPEKSMKCVFLSHFSIHYSTSLILLGLRLLTLAGLFFYSLPLYTSNGRTHARFSTCVQVRGQHHGVHSLSPSTFTWVQDSISACRACVAST